VVISNALKAAVTLDFYVLGYRAPDRFFIHLKIMCPTLVLKYSNDFICYTIDKDKRFYRVFFLFP
jgi:hypothetical protein